MRCAITCALIVSVSCRRLGVNRVAFGMPSIMWMPDALRSVRSALRSDCIDRHQSRRAFWLRLYPRTGSMCGWLTARKAYAGAERPPIWNPAKRRYGVAVQHRLHRQHRPHVDRHDAVAADGARCVFSDPGAAAVLTPAPDDFLQPVARSAGIPSAPGNARSQTGKGPASPRP
jgi:hypothetical protein